MLCLSQDRPKQARPTMSAYSAPSGEHGSRSSSTLSLSHFPGEDPTRAQVETYFEIEGPTLRRAGYGPAMRGEHPPHLVALAVAAGMPDMTSLSAEERAAVGPIEAHKHDMSCTKANRERDSAARQLRSGLQEYHNRLAAILESSLRPKASLRLQSLLAAHKVPGVEDCYNGGAMWRELLMMRDSAGTFEDLRYHDRMVEQMRDTRLPNGCNVQDFADKVNVLTRDHLRFLERPLTGDNLGRFIINLMPSSNAHEGRALIRELVTTGNLSNSAVVIRRCTEIVRDSSDSFTNAALPIAALLEGNAKSDADSLRAQLLAVLRLPQDASGGGGGGKGGGSGGRGGRGGLRSGSGATCGGAI